MLARRTGALKVGGDSNPLAADYEYKSEADYEASSKASWKRGWEREYSSQYSQTFSAAQAASSADAGTTSGSGVIIAEFQHHRHRIIEHC